MPADCLTVRGELASSGPVAAGLEIGTGAEAVVPFAFAGVLAPDAAEILAASGILEAAAVRAGAAAANAAGTPAVEPLQRVPSAVAPIAACTPAVEPLQRTPSAAAAP